MKKIVVFNQKGGTGKTVCTVNIAGCIESIFHKRVLVVDCDSQMNCTNYLLTHQNSEYEYDIVDCINNRVTMKEAAKRIKLQMRKMIDTNIFVLAGSRNIDTEEISDVYVLKNTLEIAEHQYDYCLFDCPPHISNMTISALAAADYVIVPALADTDSLSGYDLLLDTINNIRNSGVNINLKILGIFFNNVESAKSLDSFIMNDCKENMGDAIFKTSIRRSSRISQARFYGKPISYYKPTGEITEDYEQLVLEIIKKIKKLRSV